MAIRVAIQGVAGAFHDMAAKEYFTCHTATIIPCDTFKEAFDAVKENRADTAMVAIENSLAGSLLPNYSLLKNSGLAIAGEIYLRIEQHFMALPGQSIEEITEVQSHPLAIIQCDEFLEPMRKRGVKIIDSVDTALSAKRIAEQNLKGVAALASGLAARMYKLQILAESVETNKRNFTRFMALAPEKLARSLQKESGMQNNKASLSFTLPHQTGSLSQVLSMLAFYKLNLTKIQSAPIIGKEWEYIFYIDLLFEDYDMYTKALDAVRPIIDQLQI
ncbi:MAG: prephenate dehydratase, partial [Bacteroidetes bacterium]